MSDNSTNEAGPNETSLFDTLRVLTSVVAPTIAKGVIKRRPSVESLAQHHGLDTKALELLQDLRRKYGSDPLQLNVLLRSQILLLNPEHAAEVLLNTPVPFGSASKEKRSALRHFEPGNILIASPEERARLRPVHEHALATGSKIHPFVSRFANVVTDELRPLLASSETEVDWKDFSAAWSKLTLRIALGDNARDDKSLVETLDQIRRTANWGFLALTDHSRLDQFREQVAKYLDGPDRQEGSLASRLPQHADESVDLPSQVAQWLFAFDAAGMATFRALALLGAHPQHRERVEAEARASGETPLARAMLLESVRLWPTTPAILRETNRDAEIGGKKVEQGTGIVVFAPFFHRDDETLGPVAHRLSPELWAGKDEVDLEKGFVPFSAGSAMCPAHNLVPAVASLVVCGLAREREISLIHPQLDPEKLPGTLDNFEIKLKLSKRE